MTNLSQELNNRSYQKRFPSLKKKKKKKNVSKTSFLFLPWLKENFQLAGYSGFLFQTRTILRDFRLFSFQKHNQLCMIYWKYANFNNSAKYSYIHFIISISTVKKKKKNGIWPLTMTEHNWFLDVVLGVYMVVMLSVKAMWQCYYHVQLVLYKVCFYRLVDSTKIPSRVICPCKLRPR